jgi:hypothetical protein
MVAAMITDVAPGVIHIARRASTGWTVDMIVVDLGDGGLIYSPVWIGDDTPSIVSRFGRPRVVVSPNHYHHVSLGRFVASFPECIVVASDEARPRLASKGHAGVRPLGDAALPANVRLLPCAGTKTGETWMLVERDGKKTLSVCDSFFNVPERCTGFMGFMLRALRTVPDLQLGRTFAWLAVRDARVYREWAIETLSREKPDVIAFAHGAPLRDRAWHQCVELLERLL